MNISKERKLFTGKKITEYGLSFLLALLFSLLLFFLLPFSINKYVLYLEWEALSPGTSHQLYEDLDGDGNIEFVRFKTDLGNPAIVVEDLSQSNKQQLNLRGEWLRYAQPAVSDLDGDGKLEIVGFLYSKDSLLMVVAELFSGKEFRYQYFFVDSVSLYQDRQDWRINSVISDVNDDGYQDLVFTVCAGFSRQPRSLYLLDMHKKKIIRQNAFVSNNIIVPLVIDINRDGMKEITGSTYAPGNDMTGKYPYSDSLAWLMVYDKDLNLIRSPLALGDKGSRIVLFPFSGRGNESLAGLVKDPLDPEMENRLFNVGMNEDSLYTEIIHESTIDPNSKFVTNAEDGGAYLFNKGVLCKYNHKLELKQKISLSLRGSMVRWSRIDLNEDGRMENIGLSDLGEMVLYTHDFRHGVTTDYNSEHDNVLFSHFRKQDASYLFISQPQKKALFRYQSNPYYPVRFLIFFILLGLNYVLFHWVFRFQRKRLEFRQKAQSRLLKYQLANVQHQLEPHFLFNAINNIAHCYQEGDNEKAYNYVSRISQLMVTSMENSERTTITMKEELFFVKNYLTLEQLRNGSFDFEMDVKEKLLLEFGVPKMLVQNFVENSVKHGIRHLLERKGRILIYSREKGEGFELTIEDNGIGRKRAAEITTYGAKRGLSTLERILILHEELNNSHISFSIEDLVDEESNPCGTRVIILLED